MNSLIDDLNAEQFNTFDPTTFLYLNPLFQHTCSNSIEKTYAFMVSNDYSVGYLTQNLTLNYPTFDYAVYYHYASNGIHDYFFDDADTFGGLPYFDRSNTKRLIDIYFSQHGVELDVFFEMDSNFNPEIYRLFHRIVQPMTTQELYIDYLTEKENQSNNFLIGNLQELTMMVRSNVTLEFSDLVVREDGYVMNTLYVRNQAHIDGGMTIYGDGSNVVINGGGGLMVDATYNDVDAALGHSTSEDPLNIVFNWITDEQIGLYLSGFSNDLAPWLTYDSKNIHLSQFSNDMGPWLSNITSVINYSDDEITLFQSQTTKLNLGYLHKPIHNITTENIYIQNYLESIDGIINNSLSVGSNVYTSNLVSSNVITQNITILDDITIYDTLSVGSNLFTSNIETFELKTTSLFLSYGTVYDTLNVGSNVFTSNLVTSNVITQNITILDDITIYDTLSVGSNLYTSNVETIELKTTKLFLESGTVNDFLSVGSNMYTSNLVSSNVITQNITILDDITIYDTLSVGSNLFTSNIETFELKTTSLSLSYGTVDDTLSVGSNVFTSNLTSQILTTENVYSSNSSTSNASISESISVGGTVYTDWLYVRNNASIGGTLTADGLLIVNGGSVEIGTTRHVNVNYTMEAENYTMEAVNYTTTFDVQWNTLDETSRTIFENTFKLSVANALGVSVDDVVIHTVTDGSTIVDASVYVVSSTTTTVSEIIEKLQTPAEIFSIGPVFGNVSPIISDIIQGVSSVKGEKPKRLASSSLVIVGDISDTSVIINWVSGDNGDAIVNKYSILANNVVIVDDIDPNMNSFTVYDLVPNMNYVFVVRKVTDIGSFDSSGLYVQQRKLYTAGFVSLTGQSSELTTIGYGYSHGLGDDIHEIYLSSSDWIVIRTNDGTFYSLGRDIFDINRLGRLDENGLQYNDNSVYLTNREPNDILNNSKVGIKNIALVYNACIVLTVEGRLMYYGHTYPHPITTTELIESNVVDDLIANGWSIDNIYGLYKSFAIHLKKANNVDKIIFSGSDYDVHDSDGTNVQLENFLSQGGQIEEIHTLHRLFRIKIDGVWYAFGRLKYSYSEGTSWGEESRAYVGAPDPIEVGVSQNTCGLIKLDVLNQLLQDNPGSYLVKSSVDALCVYSPSDGNFYMMSSQPGNMQFGPNLSESSHTFRLVPEMNLNNIGVEGTYLANVNGEFEQFLTWYKVGGFLTKTFEKILEHEIQTEINSISNVKQILVSSATTSTTITLEISFVDVVVFVHSLTEVQMYAYPSSSETYYDPTVKPFLKSDKTTRTTTDSFQVVIDKLEPLNVDTSTYYHIVTRIEFGTDRFIVLPRIVIQTLEYTV